MGAVTIFSSASRSSNTNSSDQNINALGGSLMLDISSVSGSTPTLDVKLQRKDSVSDNYVDIPGASFSQQTGTGTTMLTIYPGMAETANEGVSDSVLGTIRGAATISGTFTFSLSLEEFR